jgi:hypothetical protein
MSDIDKLIAEGDNGGQVARMATDWTNILEVNKYQFMEEAYKGTSGFENGMYLVGYHMEYEDSLTERKILSEYPNYVKPIVNSSFDPIFEEEPVRKLNDKQISDPMLEGFITNTDNAGASMTEFMNGMILYSSLQFVTFAVVENFPADEMHETAKENEENRIYPYVYRKNITSVAVEDGQYMAKFDKFGNLESIVFNDEPVKEESGMKPRYRYWSKEYTVLMKDDDSGEKVEIPETLVELNLNDIPVIPMYTVKREDRRTLNELSKFHSLARKCFALFNLISDLSALFRKQGYSLLYIQGMPAGAFVGGTNNFINLGPSATIEPGFASPDSNIPKAIMESIKGKVEEIYQLAGEAGIEVTNKAQSGVAKEWDFQARNTILMNNKMNIESIEKKIVEVFADYTKKTKEYTGYDVNYFSDFTPQNDKALVDTITIAINDIQVNPIAASEMRKLTTSEILKGNVSEEVLKASDALDDEIAKKEVEELNNPDNDIDTDPNNE